MIYDLQKQLYKELRDGAKLSQNELAVVSAVPRSNIQRIEKAKKVPTPEEEEALLLATDNTRLSAAELICKALSDLIGRRVAILDDEVDYRATTPEGELTQLLHTARGLMPRHRWWQWRERVGRYKAFGQLHEDQGHANVRDLSAEVEDLLRQQEEAAEPAAEAAEAPAAENGEDADLLAFSKP